MDLLCTERFLLNDPDSSAERYNNNTLSNNSAILTTTTNTNGSTNYGNNNNKISNNINFNNNNNYLNCNTAALDPTFLTDRCLENLLKAEEKIIAPQINSYFKDIQKDITPDMRKLVAEWMMDLCEEQKCQEEVYLLALNYMDRFLSTTSVKKNHLQILGAACLLLASKLREPSCKSLDVELLVYYTKNSIYKTDLIHWELYVLSRLKWDLSSVNPLDFLELLLIRLPVRNTRCLDLSIETVRTHAQVFISLAAKEHFFSMYSASTIAGSSIAAALGGLNWHLRTGITIRNLLNLLTDLIGVQQDLLHECMILMEKVFEEHTSNLQPYVTNINIQEHKNSESNHCNTYNVHDENVTF